MRLTWRDAVATVLVGGSVAVYVLFRQGTDLPVVSGPRGVAAVLLVVGLAACITGGDNLSDGPVSRVDRVSTRLGAALGGSAFVVALLVLITGYEPLLGVLVGITVALWLLATARHAQTPAAPHARASK